MNKKRIIVCFALGIVIVITLLCLAFINHEEYTEKVKKYEVVEDGLSVSLNILEEIPVPKFKSNLKEGIPLKSIKKDLSMQYILNIIKDYDKTFDEKDYKFTLNGASSYITLNYHINDIIETTKAYSVFIKDNKVSHITVAGVQKGNIDNITTIDKTKLLELVSNFKDDYKAQKIYESRKGLFKTNKVLKKDGTINTDNMKIEVKELEEKYLYDFDTEKLWYEVTIMMVESDGEITDGGAIQVVLN